MNLVDSSAWIAYFADTKNAAIFAKPIESQRNLLIPTIVLYEVFKKAITHESEEYALEKIALMQRGHVAELTAEISLEAAIISKKYKLPMADSIILATAKKHNAHVWTQDADFKEFPDVTYLNSN